MNSVLGAGVGGEAALGAGGLGHNCFIGMVAAAAGAGNLDIDGGAAGSRAFGDLNGEGDGLVAAAGQDNAFIGDDGGIAGFHCHAVAMGDFGEFNVFFDFCGDVCCHIVGNILGCPVEHLAVVHLFDAADGGDCQILVVGLDLVAGVVHGSKQTDLGILIVDVGSGAQGGVVQTILRVADGGCRR